MTESMSKMATGINALMQEYQAISHNIANSQTPGYKKNVTSFRAELQRLKGTPGPLTGRIAADQTTDFTQGNLIRTERTLDVGLEGKGFIALDTPSGRLYTRNGVLQINILGQLTDLNGFLVSGRNGPINIPDGVNEVDIRIDEEGMIRAGEFELGALQIGEFDDLNQLKSAGNGCYRGPADFRPREPEETVVRQGFRETSNVRMMEELTGLMTVSRLFEANMNILRRSRENSSAMIDVAKG